MDVKKWGVLFLIVVFSLALVVGCGTEENADSEGDYRDGVYTAVSQFNRGYVEATVTISGGVITNVEIVEFTDLGVEKIYEDYHQRFPVLEDAHTTLAADMAENNTWDVDVVTGATSTSEKAKEAVKFALIKAAYDEPENTYFNGTFFGMSEVGERGWGIAHVTIENDEIIDIRLEETTAARDEDGDPVFDSVGRQVFELKDEDYSYDAFHEAREAIAKSILDAQSPDVDTYTGATGSADMWMEAVRNALDNALTG